MTKKIFTLEEINILEKNPFTSYVTPKTISFTQKFKENFIEKYNAGMRPRQIFIEHGYDPKMLGRSRVDGISKNIRQQHNSLLEGDAASNGKKPPKKVLSEKEQLKKLQQEVEYLKQEIEFLKKISSIRTTQK